VQKALAEVQPALVITLGALPLALFHGTIALGKWRGSRLQLPDVPFTILPTIHPRTLVKQPDQGFILRMDLTRAYKIFTGEQLPRHYRFDVAPTYAKVEATLRTLLLQANRASPENPLKLSGDIETRSGYTACMGIAWSATDAICIPHHVLNPNNPFYWTLEEEANLVQLYAQLFHHPNVLWVGQNYLYDCQYFYRHWGILPIAVRDTMVAHHSLHSNIRKGLDFLSSMYAQDHVYWKDEIKEWDASIGEKQYWTYNCKDACITFEIGPEIEQSAIDKGMKAHFDFKQSLFYPVLRMMNRGIKLDITSRVLLKQELTQAAVARQGMLNYLVGHELNPKSPAQLSKFFYEDMGIPGVKNFVTDNLTTNSTAIVTISEREPLLQPLCKLILELRSLGVFLSTFIGAQLDTDGRMRCGFGIAATETDRFNSRENAFGSGMNLQNIPKGGDTESGLQLPNIRSLFIPDPGMTYFDIDLASADLRIVVWEADEPEMKAMLKAGLDPYTEIAKEFYNDPTINKKDPRRQTFKSFAHGTNYLGTAEGLAGRLGLSVSDAKRTQEWYFKRFPRIKIWQEHLIDQVYKKRMVQNVFGYRCNFFDRIEGTIFNEAAGWYVFRTPFIVHKINSGRVPLPTMGPRRQYETLLYAIKGQKNVTHIYPDVIPCTADDNMTHGAQKPVELFQNLLQRSVRAGDKVLDTFSGTGTIFPAAHNLLCEATATEMNPEYYAMNLKRIQALEISESLF